MINATVNGTGDGESIEENPDKSDEFTCKTRLMMKTINVAMHNHLVLKCHRFHQRQQESKMMETDLYEPLQRLLVTCY